MSFTVMGLVWGTTLPDSEMIVALALADRCEDDGACWRTSNEWLVWKTNKGERTVRNALGALQARGVLSCSEVRGKANRYRFDLAALKALAKPMPVKKVREPRQRLPGSEAGPTPATAAGVEAGAPATAGRGTPATAAPATDGYTTSLSDESETRARARPGAVPEDFGAWFAAYPWRVDEPAARAAFEAACDGAGLPPIGDLVEANRRYGADAVAGGRQLMNPVTFLRRRRWEAWLPGDGSAAGALLEPTLPEWLHLQACGVLGEARAASLLAAARLEDRSVRTRTRWAFDQLRGERGFMALLDREQLMLEAPPPRTKPPP